MPNRRIEAAEVGFDEVFDGSLDDIAVYNYALTAADIALLYNGYRVLDFQERHCWFFAVFRCLFFLTLRLNLHELRGVATWLAGETTSVPLNTAPAPGASTFHAISVCCLITFPQTESHQYTADMQQPNHKNSGSLNNYNHRPTGTST